MTDERGVLWDMDGVLIDTSEAHFQTWATVLARHDIPFDRDTFEAVFGMNNVATLGVLLGHEPTPELAAEIGDEKERLFRDAMRGHATPLPGVLAWLERLQAEGVRQAVASSAPQENIDVLVDGMGLRPFFDAIISGQTMPPKPDPAIFLEAARRLDVPNAGCVVIEDSVHGIEGAKRAGMRCIAVTTTRPTSALQTADLVVERLDALSLDDFGW